MVPQGKGEKSLRVTFTFVLLTSEALQLLSKKSILSIHVHIFKQKMFKANNDQILVRGTRTESSGLVLGSPHTPAEASKPLISRETVSSNETKLLFHLLSKPSLGVTFYFPEY